MPLCGFNEEMLEGMEKFHESLVESVLAKSSNKIEEENKEEQ